MGRPPAFIEQTLNLSGGNMTENEHDSRQFRVFHPTVVALVTAAVLLRLGLSFMLPRTINGDEPMYLLLGYNLLAGNGFTYSGYPELHFTPLYPIVAGLFHVLIGDFETASNLVYALFGGLLLFPVFAMARRIYGVKTAWLAAVLMAIFPALTVNVLYWGSLTEPLYLSLLYGGLALLLIGLEDDRLGMLAAAGALLGLAYLTRPEAVVYFGVFVIFAWIWLLKSVNCGIRRTWFALGSFVLPFVVLALPYIWYLHVHTGQWMISGKIDFVSQEASASKRYIYFDLMPGGEIAWLSPDRFQRNTLQSALTNPGDILRRVIKNGRSFKDQFFAGGNFWWGLTPLVVVALLKHPWDQRRVRHEAFLITIILVLLLTFLPFFFVVRLFAPAFPVLLIWTARGALYLGRWLQDTVELWREKSLSNPYLKSVLGWLPAGMVTGILILTIPVTADGWIRTNVFGYKEAGLWLKAHTPADAKVMTQEVAVALYADRHWVPSPNTDWAHFMQYARSHDANYLVVGDFKLVEYQPQLAHTLQKGTPELELVFSFEESHMPGLIKTLVYRISKSSDE
jgi:4-amino-4-deoxy-L-arabinose transferase-like glycosyltransferase